LAGGLIRAKWLSGAPNPDGEGRVPNITGGKGGIGDWSAADIAYYLESGFTPAFDSVGGSMVEVQENMAKLTAEDRDAIAAYLKAVPAVDTAK
jgi:mono/diheme cytochrome c family protein